MKKYKKLLIILSLILLVFFLTGCGKNEQEDLKNKAKTEIEYLDTKIISMLNNLNNLSFEKYKIISRTIDESDISKSSKASESESTGGTEKSSGKSKEEGSGKESEGESGGETENSGGSKKENEGNMSGLTPNSVLSSDRENIDWDVIKSDIEILNKTWGIILLDLYELKISNDDILDFSEKINSCIIAIKNEDKQQSLEELSDLYSNLPIFLEGINAEQNEVYIKQTQDYIIKAYVNAENMENLEIRTNIQKAIDTYSHVITNIDYTKDKTFKTNKIYVLLNELANSLNANDSDVFYVKYINFMEAISAI